MEKNKLHFIMTGGTIDSYYDGIKDTVVPHKKSIIPKYINSLNLNIKTNFTQICMKDSRDLSIKDMKKVKEQIEKSKSNYFIVTHGTYTMPDTARYLQQNIKRKKCVVVLTGSMIPLESFAGSDALFNLGFSIGKIFDLKSGIYVAMNGNIFNPNEIAKLVNQGRFISIFQK